MPAPRQSYSGESARDAALQAEFNEKKWVWVPDDKEGYLAGWVVQEDGDEGEVILASGGEYRRVHLMILSKMNPPKFDRVDDIADLTFLNEASVVHNLRLRYGSGAIYTYSGLFLVAINPYTNLPLYTDAVVQQYRGKRKDENPPHIFAIAERAWVNMGEERENQSILITGESGAGKTENTKKVIQYLAAIATDHDHALHHSRSNSVISIPGSSSYSSIPTTGLPRSSSFRRSHRAGAASVATKASLGLLERQILQANPILEAFGNAQTQRNNNSSRFGKFIRISFAGDGGIAGANIDWYLLEKSRVTTRSEVERSFHVFYQLLEGGGSLKDALLLDGSVGDYEYLNKSRATIDGVDDLEEWRSLKTALDTVGFSYDEQVDLFRIVAAILHIGNIEVTEDRANQAQIRTPSQLEKVCHLLGLPVTEFSKAVLKPRVLAGREWVTQARTKQQALDELSALCKTLYEKCFGALVDRINRALDRPSNKSTFIGVLDIAGFEIFVENSFEQLCINFTNEKLQQFFNHHMFVLEQEEYQREGIEWNFVNFGLDLQPTIELIESREPIGILSCLDEECIMPKATDATFTQKVQSFWTPIPNVPLEDNHPGVTKFAPTRFVQGFIIQHYAGRVEYRTEGWLEKNKDPLSENVNRVLGASTERYIAELFREFAVGSEGTGLVKKRVKKGAFRTVAQRHREQLSSLMLQLGATQPHFVRCIVPNTFKKPGRIDVPLVLDQLRCNGVLEGIRIARLGYPNRLPFAEFRQRYEVLTPGVIPKGYMDGRKACTRMVAALELDDGIFKIGNSKIFFRAGVLAELEERRDALLFDIFSRIQSAARRFTARRQMKKILNRAVAIRTIQRNARVYGQLKEWPWWQLYTKIRPLLAATRNDEELRKKEVELVLIRERADRDKKEKAALEALKMQLEQGKRKVEDDLQAERNLGIDKDQALQRSKAREAELEEEAAALQGDLDTIEGQLDRAIEAQKATEEKYQALKEAFDQAADHLVRLEGEEKRWKLRETQLLDEGHQRGEEWAVLSAAKNEVEKEADNLKRSLKEKEEDLQRVKHRMDTVVADLESRIQSEAAAKDNAEQKLDSLDQEARQSRQQLTELARTATDLENMIQKKEADKIRLSSDMATLRRENIASRKESVELRGKIDTLSKELEAQKTESGRGAQARANLQSELDELRAIMAAKTSEESKRNEVERGMEQELSGLRQQSQDLHTELAGIRREAAEMESRLKIDLESARRDHESLNKSHQDALSKSKKLEAKLAEVEASLISAEKAKRSAESELQVLRSKHIDSNSKLAEAAKHKETLERQLASAQGKHRDYEDAILQLEREKTAWTKQMENIRKQLDDESNKRLQLESSMTAATNESAKLKDRCAKLDKELAKAHGDLAQREHEIKHLESKQDKTIVEHVHVLQEAKAFTDRQLAQAEAELEKQKGYIKSLEKTKARLTGEAEDLTRQTEREKQELRAREKAARTLEDKATRTQADLERERRSRETADLASHRAQQELKNAKSQLEDMGRQMAMLQRAKGALENELENLAAEGEFQTETATAKMKRQYEGRIAQLETQAQESADLRTTAERIKQRVDRQHAELRKLLSAPGPKDDNFRARLLKELELADQELEHELSARTSKGRLDGVRSYTLITPSKRLSDANGIHRNAAPEPPKTPDRKAAQLQQQLQVMEVQMMASERIRQHLQQSLQDLSSDLESSDGSKQSLQSHRAKIARENARLKELLEDEAEARRSAAANQVEGVQSMWAKFQTTIAEERANYAKLEESRKALIAQQRTAQVEVEDSRRQITELSQAKKHLQSEVADLRERVEIELIAKNEEAAARKKLQTQLHELESVTSVTSAVQGELKEAMEAERAKADTYRTMLEAAQIAEAKAARAESRMRTALADAEAAQVQAVSEREVAESRLSTAEQRVRELENQLEDNGLTDEELLHARLAEEMAHEREQYRTALADRDFAIEQTRNKYNGEFQLMSDEIQAHRSTITRLREDLRKMNSERDGLSMKLADEEYSANGWKGEKERLETKINDISQAYEKSNNAQTEQQSQIVSLLSQVRELRRVLDEAEAERSNLLKARRTLEARLTDIAQEHLDTSKMTSDRAVQALHLERQELRSLVEEQTEKMSLMNQKLKKAETHTSDYQSQLEQIRLENAELDKANAALEKTIKELNGRMVDMETKNFTNSPKPDAAKVMQAKIADLQGQVNQLKERNETLLAQRTANQTARTIQLQLTESERQRSRQEEELRKYEARIEDMKQQIDQLQKAENALQLAKRRAERDCGDFKQHALTVERELERLKGRLEHSTVLGTGSPRKL